LPASTSASPAASHPLAPFGWNDRVVALFNDLDQPATEPARVVRVEFSRCAVVSASSGGEERFATAPVLPAVGDWVALQDDTVAAVVPQWSALTRLDPDGATVQVLAANLDLVFVTAPADRLSPARIERELVAAWDSGAQPVVVLTKADVAPPGLAEELRERLLGVDVLATSAATGEGVDDVRHLLRPSRTAVLLGPSGAGKSTLANRLLGADVLATGEVRADDHRGRHTTTSRQLVAVPGGGVLIDTPGLRSLALALGGYDSIERVFPDVDELASQCRFRDCQHSQEPGCAVQTAIADGTLAPARLASYEKLAREDGMLARRSDPIARKATLAMWKARAKAGRENMRRKGR
jgi:ribosome biogenesis GTPase